MLEKWRQALANSLNNQHAFGDEGMMREGWEEGGEAQQRDLCGRRIQKRCPMVEGGGGHDTPHDADFDNMATVFQLIHPEDLFSAV